MKEGFDREIDSLLRRRARGTAELRSWGDAALGAHLDADELSAFAEGALPSAARFAAASHLADCERCRGVVVGLARVAGAGAEVKLQAAAATASKESERTPAWRALFASLLSPRLMRFAVPVLALSLVGAVSYVALRSKSGAPSQVATTDAGRRAGVPQEQPNTTVAPSANVESANTSGVLDRNTDAPAKQEPATAPAQPEQRKEKSEADARPDEAPDGGEAAQPSTAAPPPPPPASAATTTTEGPAEIAKAAPRPVTTEETEVTRNESRDRAESREKSARGAEPADDNTANDASLAQRRAAQSRMNQAQMPDGGARNEKRADNNASGGYNAGNAAAAPKDSERESAATRSETRRARAAKQGEKKADEDETSRGGGDDTRTAAGHRFRREGNRWVDVNYKSDMSSTGVRRGTDAFRALVADVPVVGRVAEALGGEVIVVVNGRAYHIR